MANEINNSVPNVRLLVSIREEDLNESPAAEWDFSCSYVYVKLDKDEAREIFEYFKTETAFPPSRNHGSRLAAKARSWSTFFLLRMACLLIEC